MDWLTLMQWPAMVASITAAWMVASTHAVRRKTGFWIFLGSNVLWTVWGVHEGAWALVGLQAALAVLNIRGARKTAP